MSCSQLAKGRALPCTSSSGGIKHIWFTEYGTLGDLTISGTTGEVTAISGTPTLNRYDVEGANGLEQAVTSSVENGSIFYDQTLTVTLKKLDVDSQFELTNLLKSRVHIFIEDYNGNYFLIGHTNGALNSGGSITTGQALGDLSGFSALTFNAQETIPAPFVTSSVVTGASENAQIEPA